jgi:hypothetical protein
MGHRELRRREIRLIPLARAPNGATRTKAQPWPEVVVGLTLPTTAGLLDWLPCAGATTAGPLVVALAVGVGLGEADAVAAGAGGGAGGGATGTAVVGAGPGTDETWDEWETWETWPPPEPDT